jgi:hypothetical protein
MPKTSMNFIGRVGFFVITVQQILTNTLLSSITIMLYVNFVSFGRIRQPFLGKKGLDVLGKVTARWDDGNGVLLKVIGPIH